jgi:hypothetical protein
MQHVWGSGDMGGGGGGGESRHCGTEDTICINVFTLLQYLLLILESGESRLSAITWVDKKSQIIAESMQGQNSKQEAQWGQLG